MKLSKTLVLAIVGCLLMSASVFASSNLDIFGKVSGKVVDKATNQPMIGVNVILVGTTIGATTNENGLYTILKVSPGTYEVELSFIGYSKTIVQKVQVRVNQTTTINVEMEETVLEIGGEIVVVAERPLVQKDRTSSSTIISGDDIENIPSVTSAQDLLVTMAGVVGDGESISVRGGRSGEVLYLIDGMPVNDPLYSSQTVNVNKYAISEIELQTGGFNAEYGNAQSGVVNIITKSGGTSLSGRLAYYTDNLGNGKFQSEQDPFAIDSKGSPVERWYKPLGTGLNTFSQNTKRLEFNLGGPLTFGIDALGGKVDFFFSGIFETKDGFLPTGNQKSVRRFIPTFEVDEFDNILNYTYAGSSPQFENVDHPLSLPVLPGIFGADGLFKWGGRARNNYNVQATVNITLSPTIRINIGAIQSQFYNQSFSNTAKFVPTKSTLTFRNGGDYKIGWTHTLSNSSFYTLRVGAFINRNEAIPGLYNGSLYYPGFQNSGIYDGLADNYSTGEGGPPGYGSLHGVGSDGLIEDDSFFGGFRKFHLLTEDGAIDGGGGLLSQNWQVNDTKTFTAKLDYTNQFTPHHEIKTGIEAKYMDLLHQRIDGRNVVISRNWENTNGPWPQHGTDRDFYNRWPNQGAVYIQDKIEYETLIIQAGLRYDRYDPGEGSPKTDGTPGNAEPKQYIQPRLGVSHPITEKAYLYFFYGKFVEFPDYSDLYRQQNQFRVNQNQINLFGNPDLQAEETTEYEVGFDYQVSDDFKIGATGFQKDQKNLIDSEVRGTTAENWAILINRDYGTDRGFEFDVTKRYSHFFSGRMNYTLSWATGKSSTFTQGYDTGLGGLVPLKENFLDWDQRHVINGDIRFEIPRGRGPTIFGNRFDRWGLSFLLDIRSGRPYTPDTGDEEEVEENSGRRPWVHTLDVRFRKDFDFVGNMIGSFYIDAINIYNRRNVYSVNSETGTVFGPPLPDGRIPPTNLSPSRFGAPLNIVFGFALRF